MRRLAFPLRRVTSSTVNSSTTKTGLGSTTGERVVRFTHSEPMVTPAIGEIIG